MKVFTKKMTEAMIDGAKFSCRKGAKNWRNSEVYTKTYLFPISWKKYQKLSAIFHDNYAVFERCSETRFSFTSKQNRKRELESFLVIKKPTQLDPEEGPDQLQEDPDEAISLLTNALRRIDENFTEREIQKFDNSVYYLNSALSNAVSTMASDDPSVQSAEDKRNSIKYAADKEYNAVRREVVQESKNLLIDRIKKEGMRIPDEMTDFICVDPGYTKAEMKVALKQLVG